MNDQSLSITHPKFVVTVTGADDAVDPVALVALSRRFPFVEWGILVSATRDGTPRYPSELWRSRLVGLGDEVRFSAHLCGRAAKSLMAGRPWCPAPFRRLQVNGYRREGDHDRDDHSGLAGLVHAAMQKPMSVILQARTVEAVQEAVLDAAAFTATCRVFGSSAEVLCDPSAGTGAPIGKEFFRHAGSNSCGRNDGHGIRTSPVRVGYAGGIGPGNVEAVLTELRKAKVGDTWIDMESGVRSGDKFDLDKVAAVLEIAAQFVPWTTVVAMPATRSRHEGDGDE